MLTIGLDFGTTNSALALSDGAEAKIVKIGNAGSGERTMPSVVFIDEKHNVHVGQDAIARHIEQNVHGRFIQSLKTLLPDPSFVETNIFGRRYKIEELISFVLAEIKITAEKYAGQPIERVVLGRPVFFSEIQKNDRLAQERLHLAALRAGFAEVGFAYEPVAATLAYPRRTDEKAEQLVLMGDFGGGTSDFTVMQLHSRHGAHKQKEKVLSIGGVYIGGDIFDSRIMWTKITPYFGRNAQYTSASGQLLHMPAYIVHSICKWHMIPFLREPKTMQAIQDIARTAEHPQVIRNLENLILGSSGFDVFQAIERAKKELSSRVEVVLHYEDGELTIDDNISRSEFEQMISQDVDIISERVSRVVADAGLEAQDIEKVLLTGGSSFVPAIRRVFEETFGENKLVHLDAFTSVAYGLALSPSLR